MIKDRIEFEKLYPTGAYANERYIIGGRLEDGDDIQECYRQLRDEVEKSFVAMNPQITWYEEKIKSDPVNINPDGAMWPQPISIEELKEERIKALIATINMCDKRKFLDNFKRRVDEENNKELTEAYIKKLNELTTDY